MRHLLALPLACIMLAACAAPSGPQARTQVRNYALAPGASVEAAPGILLRLDEVEDSRCPPGVRCVWAGRMTCRFSLVLAHSGAGAVPESFTLAPGEAGHVSALLGGARVELDESSLPAPVPQGAVANHRVTVKVLP